MKRFLLAIALAAGVAACSQQGSPVGPSVGAAFKSMAQLAQSTIAVLDGIQNEGWAFGQFGIERLTLEADADPHVHVQWNSTADPCPSRYPGKVATYLIDHDDDPETRRIIHCQ